MVCTWLGMSSVQCTVCVNGDECWACPWSSTAAAAAADDDMMLQREADGGGRASGPHVAQ